MVRRAGFKVGLLRVFNSMGNMYTDILEKFTGIYRLIGVDDTEFFSGLDIGLTDFALLDSESKADYIRSLPPDDWLLKSLLSIYAYDCSDSEGKRQLGWVVNIISQLVYYEIYIKNIINRLDNSKGQNARRRRDRFVRKFRDRFRSSDTKDQVFAEIFTLSKLLVISEDVKPDQYANPDIKGKDFDFLATINGKRFNFEVTYRKDDFLKMFPEDIEQELRKRVHIKEGITVQVDFDKPPSKHRINEIDNAAKQINFAIRNHFQYGAEIEEGKYCVYGVTLERELKETTQIGWIFIDYNEFGWSELSTGLTGSSRPVVDHKYTGEK
ncbi:MAG: hypothetical protein GY771_06975, partial [bacterium]|nr:hypothetical protein [bacterium]